MSAHSDAHHTFMRLATGQTVPPAELQALAADALRQIASGLRADCALKLDRPQLVRQRNKHLYTAWRILASSGDNDWQVAGKLARAIRRHKCGMHKRFLSGVDIDPDNELDAALHSAFCCGVKMVGSQRHLLREFSSQLDDLPH